MESTEGKPFEQIPFLQSTGLVLSINYLLDNEAHV